MGGDDGGGGGTTGDDATTGDGVAGDGDGGDGDGGVVGVPTSSFSTTVEPASFSLDSLSVVAVAVLLMMIKIRKN